MGDTISRAAAGASGGGWTLPGPVLASPAGRQGGCAMRGNLVAAALAMLVGWPLAAQQARPLAVGVVERPPFAMQTDDGAWLGMAVDLWRLAAEDLGLTYRYEALEREEALAALRAGRLDLVLPVDATPALEQAGALTQPLYTATMGVATKRQARVLSVVEGFLSWQFLRLVLGLSALLLVVGAAIWLLERRRNEEQFARSPVRGLGDGFWWAGVTLTTIGYGDKAPVTLLGRAVAMLWMLLGLAVSAALTAAVVTLAGVQRQVEMPEALAGRTVGLVEGSGTARFLAGEGRVEARTFPDLVAALDALDADAVEAVAAAAPVLRHVVSETGGLDLQVRETRLDPHYVTIALPEGSELLEPLNVALLERLSSESGWDLISRYLSD